MTGVSRRAALGMLGGATLGGLLAGFGGVAMTACNSLEASAMALFWGRMDCIPCHSGSGHVPDKFRNHQK